MLTTPTTELEAVNTLLSAIGEAPINSLENSGHVDAAMARSVLSEINRTLQTMGWHWNTEVNYPVPLTAPDKFAVLPSNTMRCAVKGQGRDVVQRGNRLYDRTKHTYSFDTAPTVELVILLDFDDLPQAARELCTLRAARVFQQRVMGSTTLNAFASVDEKRALNDLLNAESESLDLNILDNSAVARVLYR